MTIKYLQIRTIYLVNSLGKNSFLKKKHSIDYTCQIKEKHSCGYSCSIKEKHSCGYTGQIIEKT